MFLLFKRSEIFPYEDMHNMHNTIKELVVQFDYFMEVVRISISFVLT